MNRKQTFTIAAAALSGMLAGTAARAAVVVSSSTSGVHMVSAAGQMAFMMDDSGKHDCKGQNACKGQGGCKSGDKGCKGLNSCKGNGGCKTNTPSTAPSPKK